MHRDALLGQGQRGVHAGHPAADDEAGPLHRRLGHVERFQRGRPGHGHPYQVLGLFRSHVPLVGMDPGALVADVGHLEQILVNAGLTDAILEQWPVGQRRA